jgi:hypothetical protein
MKAVALGIKLVEGDWILQSQIEGQFRTQERGKRWDKGSSWAYVGNIQKRQESLCGKINLKSLVPCYRIEFFSKQ